MKKTDNYLFIKILLTAFFLLLLNSWLTYHIGKDFIETYFVNGVLVLSALVSFFVKYSKKGEEEKVNQRYSKWLSGILNFQVIAGCYILFFMAGCFVSSIQITSNKNSAIIPLEMFSPGGSEPSVTNLEISPKEPVVKKTVFTIPFGRSFVLDTKGFQQFNFKVYPWVGKRIVLESDLKVSPTVIARVPNEFFLLLKRVKLLLTHNDQNPQRFDLNNHATIILGQIQEIPEAYVEKWLNELRGMYTKQVLIYQTLNRWSNDEPLFIPIGLLAYDSLKMELISTDGKPFAESKGTVGTDKFMELKFKSLKDED